MLTHCVFFFLIPLLFSSEAPLTQISANAHIHDIFRVALLKVYVQDLRPPGWLYNILHF